jgi:hypothetical protein
MKRALPFIAIAAGLAVVIAFATTVAVTRPASATSRSAFARPNFEPARPGEAVDLTRHWMLGEREKLDTLAVHTQACYDALDGAGMRYTHISASRNVKGCGYNDDAVTIDKSFVKYTAPETLVMTCNLAARLELWEREVVAPAAEKHFGVPLTSVVAFGTFSCRRVNGDGPMSEHAYARAADIAGFKLADGREISVEKDWADPGPKGQFLHRVRDGACRVFAMVLSPDYNGAHKNHIHVDMSVYRECH